MSRKDGSDLNLSDDRYEAALVRFRGFIAAGRPLVTDDSDVTGEKHTHCSWGLCEAGDEFGKESWPDPEDHLWPDQFKEYGRIAPKYFGNSHWCPMDRRGHNDIKGKLYKPKEFDMGTWGCFYQCEVFKPLKGRKPPTREQALKMYDVHLDHLRTKRTK